MSKVTIRDVAREAGVSMATVSNALNNSPAINKDTKRHVLEVVERLQYVPNMSGRMLKSGKSKMLGFLTCSLVGAYFYVLIEAIERECEKRGYGLNIIYSRDPKMLMNNMLAGGLDGVFIFAGESRIGKNEIKSMEKSNIKAIFFDRALECAGMRSVVFDSYSASLELTRYLINLNRRRIYFISGGSDVFDSNERERGYRDALAEYGLPFEEGFVINGMFEEKYTYNAVVELVRGGHMQVPDAFIAGNDLSAIGCVKALQDSGYTVPDEISVAGFDDIDISQYFRPALTTVRNPIARQGVTAVDTLVRLIEGEDVPTPAPLPAKLVIRSSTAILK